MEKFYLTNHYSYLSPVLVPGAVFSEKGNKKRVCKHKNFRRRYHPIVVSVIKKEISV